MKNIMFLVIMVMSIVPVLAFYHIDGVVKDLDSHTMYIAGNYAFLNSYWENNIIDISDPCNPQLISIEDSLYLVGSMVIQDTLAYVRGSSAINVFNISEPLQPVLVAQIDSLGQFSEFGVSAPFLYICNSDMTLKIIDISDTSNPIPAGTCQLLCIPSVITIADNLVFVGGNNGPIQSIIQIIDVSNPNNPMVRYTYNALYRTDAIAVEGNIAYIAGDNSGLQIWDVSNPIQPVQIGTFNPERGVNDISIVGDTACLATEMNGIIMLDISNPESPQIIGTCDTPGFVERVFYRGNTVYVDTYDVFLIVDVSDPLPSPNILASYDFPYDICSSITVGNQYVYAANPSYGIAVFDASNPSLPECLTVFPDTGAYRIQYSNNKLFNLDMFNGSYNIIDVANPSNPQALGSYTGLDYPVAATLVGNVAYIIDGDLGLIILNVATPSNPLLVGTYADLNPDDIAIRASYVYIIDDGPAFPKVYIYNVSNPTSPQYAGQCYMPDEPNSIAVSGSYAYIVSSSEGLGVYQINNSTMLTQVSSYLPHSSSNLVFCYINGTRLFVCDQNWNEISVLSLANPAQPTLINRYKWNYSTCDMKVVNNLLFTANDYYGMHIFDLDVVVGNTPTPPATPSLAISNHPNPFSPQTTISYSLPRNEHVVLNIYNLRGQLVRNLVDESKMDGTYSVIWDGKDGQSRDVAPGIYVYRVTTGSNVSSGRMMLLK